MNNKEAWEYVLENEKLIWKKLWIHNCHNKEDIHHEAMINAVEKVMKYGTGNFNSIVHSAVIDAYRKHKDNSRDFNHLVNRGVISC